MVKSVRVLPDGSKCYSGPNCRKHSLSIKPVSSSVGDSILEELNKQRQKAAEQTKQQVNLFPKGAKRVGQNIVNPDWSQPFYDMTQQLHEKLTLDEVNALSRYQITSSITLNAYLRGGVDSMKKELQAHSSENREPEQWQVDEYVERNEKMTKVLDSIFAQHAVKFDEPQVMWRSVNIHPTDGSTIMEHVEKMYQTGGMFTDKGFMSATVDSDYMLFSARKRVVEKHGQPVVFEILAKEALPAHSIPGWGEQPNRIREGNIQSYEREMLLARDSKFKIMNVKKVTFEHSYSLKNQGTYKLPKKMTVPVIQMVQV